MRKTRGGQDAFRRPNDKKAGFPAFLCVTGTSAYFEAAGAAAASAEADALAAFFAFFAFFAFAGLADASAEAAAGAEAAGAEADAEAGASAAKAETANRPAIRAAISFFILKSFIEV
jgi:hypothetical protein